MLGETVPAPRRLEWGLINRVDADDDARRRRPTQLAERLARRARRARTRGTKRQLNAMAVRAHADGAARAGGARSSSEVARIGDFVEGVRRSWRSGPAISAGE